MLFRRLQLRNRSLSKKEIQGKNKKEDPQKTDEEMIGISEYWPNSSEAKSEQILQRRMPLKDFEPCWFIYFLS